MMKNIKKKSALAIVIATILCLSCDNNALMPAQEEPQMCDVTFSLEGVPLTRSTSVAPDGLKNMQVMVYDNSDMLLASGTSDNNTVTLQVPYGTTGNRVFAAVNFGNEINSQSVSELLSTKVRLKDEVISDGLQMFGDTSGVTFEKDVPITIQATRFASMVQIKGISAKFTAPAYLNKKFIITGIYLTNANGCCCVDGTLGDNMEWYNKMKKVPGDCDALLTDTFEYQLQDSDGTTTDLTQSHTFYCYGNPSKDNPRKGETFTPRHTRIVIETKLGAEVYYYPIDIVDDSDGVLKRNTKYIISNLVITAPGVSDPEDELAKSTLSFSVSLKPWEEGFNKTVEY